MEARMMVAALLGIWLWKAGVIKQIWGIPIRWLVAGNSCLGKIYRRMVLLAAGSSSCSLPSRFLPLLVLSIVICSV